MKNLLINPQTKSRLLALANDPPHALIFTGPAGIGKKTLATAWSQQMAVNFSSLEPSDSGSITIESVRGLYTLTRSKQQNRQIVVVDHAETMGIDAQNAFLKLLEEPRPNLTFILTAPNEDSLLPTILSRSQIVHIQPVANLDLTKLAKQQKPELSDQKIAQILFMANGRPAIFSQLLNDENLLTEHMQVMQQAKQLLNAPVYDRLASVNSLSKNREATVAVLEAMAHMTKLQISRDTSKHWLSLAQALEVCLSRLSQNGNLRAQLTNFFQAY